MSSVRVFSALVFDLKGEETGVTSKNLFLSDFCERDQFRQLNNPTR